MGQGCRDLAWAYDLIQYVWTKPKVNKANPKKHTKILEQRRCRVKQANVLDLTCGTGAAIPFLDRSNAYTGLDLSSTMLRHCWSSIVRNGLCSPAVVGERG